MDLMDLYMACVKENKIEKTQRRAFVRRAYHNGFTFKQVKHFVENVLNIKHSAQFIKSCLTSMLKDLTIDQYSGQCNDIQKIEKRISYLSNKINTLSTNLKKAQDEIKEKRELLIDLKS